MRNLSILMLLLISCFQLNAQNFSGPESIEYDAAQGRYLISNATSHQILALKNGVKTIFKTLSGTGPHGLEIVGDTLYCCNGGSVAAYNLLNGNLVFLKNLGASFLNGITHDPAGNLYLTDFSAKKIYRMNTTTRSFNVFVNATVSTPNGIIYDAYDGINPRLVFCNWNSNAQIKKVNLADSIMSTLTTTALSNCDGICKGKNGQFYVSSWGSQTIQRFDSTFTGGSVSVVTLLFNPADIHYNLLSDTLAVPNALSNTLSFHYFGSPNFIVETNASFQVKIFPNPSCSILFIESSNFQIQKITLYNSLMKEILTKEISNKTKIEMNISELDNGVYFIKVNNLAVQKVFVFH